MMVRLFLVGLLSVACPLAAFAGEEKAKAEGEAAEAAGPQFVKVGPINVPVIKEGKVVQYLMLTANLQVADADKEKTVTAYLPLLKDAYISSLYGALYADGDGQGLVDMNLIRTKLEGANKRVLPEGLVSNVLLEQVEQRVR